MTGSHVILPGEIRTRAQIHAVFGGSPQRGIAPSVEKRSVVLFSDPEEAAVLGYQDGWLAEEDGKGPIYEYTGAGSNGDQTFAGPRGMGNRAVLRHSQQGRMLHLFVREGIVPGSSTKTHRYVGMFTLDDELPFVPRQGLDVHGKMRTTIVFRLRPYGNFQRSRTDVLTPASDTTAEFVPRAVTIDMLQSAAVTKGTFVAPDLRNANTSAMLTAAAKGQLVQVGKVHAPEFPRSASAATTVRQKKALLIESYAAHLESRGHTVGSFQIKLKGKTSTLRTDLFDATDHVLYEAQGASDRDSVRVALGRLLDYRRYVRQRDRQHKPDTVVLLPGRPDSDIEELLQDHETSLVYRTKDGGFERPL
jgi:5-methylcytosine-specific restriction protein A